MSTRVRNYLLNEVPKPTPMPIIVLVTMWFSKINMRPKYQRAIRWGLDNMCDLIDTVMCRGFIPGICLYKLHETDDKECDEHTKECVDGQHRLFVLSHYFLGKNVDLPGKKPFLISWKHLDSATGRITHVFYEKTPSTEKWENDHPTLLVGYMTPKEKEDFAEYTVSITEFTTQMSLSQRRTLFRKLQMGSPVRGSDLYKNSDHVPMVAFIVDDMGWEASVKPVMMNSLATSPENYWLAFLIRMCLMVRVINNDGTEDDVKDAFMLTDGAINEMIKKNTSDLKISDDENDMFEEVITNFFSYLETLPEGVKFSPYQFYALFAFSLTADSDRMELIYTHMMPWSTSVKGKDKKKWQNKVEVAERVATYQRHCEYLESITVEARPIEGRTNIPKGVRDLVWTDFFGDSPKGSCYCCGKELLRDKKNGWHQGHIISHHAGGKDERINLRPECGGCNMSHQTEHMDAFKARCHPSVPILIRTAKCQS
jgi:hypothetical protein